MHVFEAEPFDKDTLPVPYRLAMFHLMVSYSQANYTERPEGIHHGTSLFDMDSFIAEYFVLEEGEKVAKDIVMQLARGFFHGLEFNDDFVAAKLAKYPAEATVVYDKNRSHDGIRGVFVNICLNEKTRRMRKKGSMPSASTAPAKTSDWRDRFVPAKSGSGFGVFGGFGGVTSAAPVSVFQMPAFASFGSPSTSVPAVAPLAKPMDESSDSRSEDNAVEDISNEVREMSLEEDKIVAKVPRKKGEDGNNESKSKSAKKREKKMLKKALATGVPMGLR